MSISTPAGDQRRPSVVGTGKKSAGSGARPKSTGKKTSGSGSGDRPSTKAGGGPRKPVKPVKPVKVSSERAWGPTLLFIAVVVLAVGIIGYGGWAAYQGAQPWEKRADAIDGISNYRKSDPEMSGQGDHRPGPITYSILPPVAGPHNGVWQNCMGDVYDAPIANEHAVHSLEHGAVWVTYRSDLPKDQVEVLAKKVRGNEFMMMSPVNDLDKPVSLQAWGYQLKVDNVNDGRIDEFIKVLRVRASVEPGATCARGITATGTAPRDLGDAHGG
ncbi:MAG TPA: DUF3105 domain-containing protein [Micromonosporaceae bacterium]|nr:DUF3105 domain-containing protein [Micromonosporaceae bacterium]